MALVTGGETTRTTTCTDAETRSYFCPAIVPTHSTRCDVTPSASLRSGDTPCIAPCDGSTALLIQCAIQRGTEIGKGLGGDDALTAHRVKGVEAD